MQLTVRQASVRVPNMRSGEVSRDWVVSMDGELPRPVELASSVQVAVGSVDLDVRHIRFTPNGRRILNFNHLADAVLCMQRQKGTEGDRAIRSTD